MKPYLSDHVSGVTAYLFVSDGIILKFRSKNEYYLYNRERPGADQVEIMRQLALNGSRLSTYVNQNVRERYFKRSLDIEELIRLAD
ncbi:MAG: hypothetical protein JST19_16045 [Bacteroidetes bacterium]|nr:hypothetical protein [Bacteroidota bacterium]